jgi:1,4-dihydroxy-2-naphthoate octaprenyltransferase
MSVAQRQSDEKNERMPGPANLKKKKKKKKMSMLYVCAYILAVAAVVLFLYTAIPQMIGLSPGRETLLQTF